MVLLGFVSQLSESITLAKCLRETEYTLENAWNVQHSLLAEMLANIAFARD